MSGNVVHVLSGADYDLYIGREAPRYGLAASPWANPYKIGRDGDRRTVLSRFEEHIAYRCGSRVSGVDMQHGVIRNTNTIHRLQLIRLRDLVLACWCAPKDGTPLTLDDPEVCHGQTLLRLAAECDD